MSEHLARWLKGNADAIAFILHVHEAIELWDDLIDQDKPVTQERINGAFLRLFVSIPRNGFYQRHFAELNPLIESAIIDWHTANEFERSGEHLETAYGLSCSGQALTTMCARIIGGMEWALMVNKELREMGESFEDYSRSVA